MRVELIPSAKRLIRSLRDIGYEFVDAVADIVDNSVEAQATIISINLKFEGEDSYLNSRSMPWLFSGAGGNSPKSWANWTSERLVSSL
jgi:hypothetical protein